MKVDVVNSSSTVGSGREGTFRGMQSSEECRAQELCESRGGRPELPVPNSPYGLCGRKATLNLNLRYQAELCIWSCVNVEVAVLGSPSPIVLINYGFCGCIKVQSSRAV